MQRSSIYRLYPTKVQDASVAQMLGALCGRENAARQPHIEAHRRRGITLRCNNQALELKAVWPASERGRIGIAGIPGEIAVKWRRPLPADARVTAAAASRSAGKCYICFEIKSSVADPAERQFSPVGLGLAALSAGEIVPTAQRPAKAAKGLRRTRRAVAGKSRNGNRQRMIGLGVARWRARVARSLLGRFTHVAIEDLNVRPSKLFERDHRCDRGCVLHRHVAADR